MGAKSSSQRGVARRLASLCQKNSLLFSSSQAPASSGSQRQEKATSLPPQSTSFSPSAAGSDSTRHIPAQRHCSGPGLSSQCLHTTCCQSAAVAPNIAFKIKRKAKARREDEQPSSCSTASVPGPQHRTGGCSSPMPAGSLPLQSRSGIQKQKRLSICTSSGELSSCSRHSTHLGAGRAAVPSLLKQSAAEAMLEKEHNSCKNRSCLGKCCCQQRHRQNQDKKLLPPGRGGKSRGCTTHCAPWASLRRGGDISPTNPRASRRFFPSQTGSRSLAFLFCFFSLPFLSWFAFPSKEANP